MNDTDSHSGIVNETGEAMPLARFRSDYLYELARKKDPAARRELGNVVTDLFMNTKLSLREQDIVADILITMLKQAEIDLRRAIAERVASLDRAPLRVVLYLSNDEIDVARPVLKSSPVLEDMDMILIIETRGEEYWRAIAGRSDLRASVVKALVETRDSGTARVLLGNNEIVIPEDSFSILAEISETANDICVPLLKRGDLPKDLISKIYQYVGETIRADLESELPSDRWEDIKSHIDQVIFDHVNNSVSPVKAPDRQMIEAAESIKKRGRLTFDGILQTLKNGQTSSFAAQLVAFSGMTFKGVVDMVSDERGHKMAALCRVYRIDKKMFLKFFLMTQKLRAGDRLVDPTHLNEALSKFDFMPMEDAQKIMDEMRLV